MFKALVLLTIVLGFCLEAVSEWLDGRWERSHALPSSVRDVYDEKEYQRWKQYDGEKKRLSLIGSAVNACVLIVMFAINGFAWLSSRLPQDEYANAILLLGVWQMISTLIGLPFGYIDQMKIEEKYGFNRSTKKTFFADAVKNFLIGFILYAALVAIAIACYNAFGRAFFLVLYAALAVIMLVISTFSLTFQKLFNKFEPLQEGSLRTRIETLFAQNGYQVKNIYVMNASKRTTKANAFCTGLGKYKEIALYDNLVNNFTEDEVLAVFAHELTHFKHGDTRHMTLLQLLRFLPVVLLILWVSQVPACMTQLGFDKLNFGIVFIALFEAVLGPVMLLCGIPMSAFSRMQERRADAYAAEIGLGEAMITALKKLARLNFANLNPHPLNVKLFYDHPPIDQRVDLLKSKNAPQMEK